MTNEQQLRKIELGIAGLHGKVDTTNALLKEYKSRLDKVESRQWKHNGLTMILSVLAALFGHKLKE